MNRRTFVGTLTLGLLAAPFGAEAQQAGKITRIGVLSPTEPAGSIQRLSRELNKLGWVEGENLAFESRFARGHAESLYTLAADLVRLNVDVIVAVSPPAIKAAKEATRTIPVVMAYSGIDPVRAGLVASLAHPGANVTGLTLLATDMAVKRLELLKAALPKAGRVAVLLNPRNLSTAEQLRALKAAAPALRVQLQPVEVGRSGEYADAVVVIARIRPDALLVPSDPEFARDGRALVDLAAQTRTPTSYEWREFVEMGGLMSYGSKLENLAERVAVYVDKILKGAKPADLPIEQPTKFELVINLKTAKALGLVIPASVLARADHIIDK